MAKIFHVAENEKCGGCNWLVRNLYLIARNEEEAVELYKENERGLCADCLVELIMEQVLVRQPFQDGLMGLKNRF